MVAKGCFVFRKIKIIQAVFAFVLAIKMGEKLLIEKTGKIGYIGGW